MPQYRRAIIAPRLLIVPRNTLTGFTRLVCNIGGIKRTASVVRQPASPGKVAFPQGRYGFRKIAIIRALTVNDCGCFSCICNFKQTGEAQ